MKIDIIGTGNVGSHLSKALTPKANIVNVNARSLAGLRPDSQVYIICVSDDAIRSVAEKISRIIPEEAVLAHTSGSTPLSLIQEIHTRAGVFYPLQTFTKGIALNYKEIPFFIEASDSETLHVLGEVADAIGGEYKVLDSQKRKDLHMAAVIASNFSNHLWALADDFLQTKGISFTHLMPLLSETLRKAMETSPTDAQTGPARRHDHRTMTEHLERLAGSPELSEIYTQMSKSIINHYPIEK